MYCVFALKRACFATEFMVLVGLSGCDPSLCVCVFVENENVALWSSVRVIDYQ